MNTIGKRIVYAALGIAGLAVGIVLYSGGATTKDVHAAAVAGWLVNDRPTLVKVARILKLQILCQNWGGSSDVDRFETSLRDRVGTNNPVDREYAAVAIREGQTDALLDFKASALGTCGALTRDDLQVVSDYLAGHRKLNTASLRR